MKQPITILTLSNAVLLKPNYEIIYPVKLIPVWGRSPRGRNGNPLQYSCPENPMDRGAWRAIVRGVAKSWTRLKRLSTRGMICLVL